MNNQQNGRVILWLTWQKYETMYRLLTPKTTDELGINEHLGFKISEKKPNLYSQQSRITYHSLL
jgi:hypothetical protein